MRRVQVPLRCLVIGEEFTTTLSGQRGSVVGTGYALWADRTGREVGLRAVHVRFASGAEKILRAEQPVLVDADRPHVRFDPDADEARWDELLREPGSMGTVGERLKAARS
jgi:hypothetical protein